MGRENDLQHAWDEVAPLTEDQDAIDEDLQMDNDAAEPYDIGQDLGLPAQVIINGIQTITVMPDEEYRRQVRILNRKQSEFVMDVLYHAKTSDKPICRFLSGGAGVGKTHVTMLLYQSLYRYFNKSPGINPDKPCILLMAPTGKAAYLIRETLCIQFWKYLWIRSCSTNLWTQTRSIHWERKWWGWNIYSYTKYQWWVQEC